MLSIDLQNVLISFIEVRLILVLLLNVFFIMLMIRKKVSTLLALPVMGIGTALIASIGVLPLFGLFDMVSGVDDKGKEVMTLGIFNGVIMEGAKMLASAIVAAIFGAAFTRVLTKTGVVKELIKRAAELGGNRPLMIGVIFYLATVLVFSSIGGLGAVILVGTIALPIMINVGISEVKAATVILLGLSVGGILNPANYATFASILAPVMAGGYTAAYNEVAQMSLVIFVITFIISLLYILVSIREKVWQKTWAVTELEKNQTTTLPWYALMAPLIPVVLVVSSTLLKRTAPAEVAIITGIIYLLLTTPVTRKINLFTASFVEGVKDVAGAIILLIGLGMLLKGFQFFTVTQLITPMITYLTGFLLNPWSYVIGFTLATPLVLYRGPLNTFGIGGALPVVFAAAGFSPLAIVWVLRATANMQGFGDPTNSQNIWIANYLKMNPNEITKKVFLIGILMTFVILVYAVFINGIPLKLN